MVPREEIESKSGDYRSPALPLSYRGMEGAVGFEPTYRQLRRLVADPIGRTRPNGTPARTRIPISTFVAWCPILWTTGAELGAPGTIRTCIAPTSRASRV